MKIRWNQLKSKRLKQTRGVSFEEILKATWVNRRPHPTRKNQELFLFELQGSIWVVPFIQDEQGFFLKTIFRSRKFTKLYHQGKL
ncbi:MAG: toxin [Candidatus Omnitrophica bacterium]|jgi:uncharacterized DUF497 family protein|nr:toxin [Candidatus Omnitrophota bacterium]